MSKHIWCKTSEQRAFACMQRPLSAVPLHACSVLLDPRQVQQSPVVLMIADPAAPHACQLTLHSAGTQGTAAHAYSCPFMQFLLQGSAVARTNHTNAPCKQRAVVDANGVLIPNRA
jgi:hypothetical protein